jgi:amino acid adenylation domain-containing protein
VVLVDDLLASVPDPAEGPASNPPVTVTVRPDDLAYVIYTSGSTGEPKAVAVPQRGLANRIACLQRIQPLTDTDRVLHKTPYTFDVSVWELIWPLTAGATLVMAAPGGHRDPAYLTDLIQRENITTAHFVPPMLEAFLGEPDLDRCRSLRRVICSGQALLAPLRDRCLSVLPWARLFNFYGPTEASIEVTEWECRPVARGTPEHAQVPIGRPIAGVETYVLDDELQLVPPGVTGELYLGGVALARGYLGRPALTADHFVPHPYAERPGSRLYRTGDLVRWRTDGVLEYLGRNDHQLKVRGFRIEPGEVENAMRAHPAVRDAVVTADGSGLIAYLVPRGDGGPKTELAVRDLIHGRLPEYMVPSRFVMLTRLPLSANGKVDLSALPAPASSPADSGTPGRTAPRNEEERILADIWSRVLVGSAIGTTDDFFAFGGDSLKSIQVVHRAREAGLSLTVGDVFRHPTVGRLAAYLRRRDDSSTSSPAGRSVPAPVQRGDA